MAKRIVLGGVAGLLVVTGLLPLAVMYGKSVVVGGQLSLAYYAEFFASRRGWTLLGHSLALATLTSALATALGVSLGILLGRTDFPFRKLFAGLFAIPLLIPPYITAISWFHILGRDGVLARLLGAAAGNVASSLLFGLPGCVLILMTTYTPLVMLLTWTFLRTVNPRLEEAGRLVAEWPDVLKRVTLPLIAPGIFLGTLLVFLLTLGEFGVPAFLRFDVYAVESFTQFSAFYSFDAATATTFPLALMTLLALGIESRFLREKTYELRSWTGSEASREIPLKRFRPWAFAGVSLLCVLWVILPLGVLLRASFSPGAYQEALGRAADSLWRSVSYAAVGATLLALVGFFAGYLIERKALPYWRGVDTLTVFLFALPSTVLGIGLVSLWNRPATAFLYSTPLILFIGYLAQYAALATRVTVSALARVSPAMEEAAQMAGARWLRRTVFITAPLARRGLAAAWLISYTFCLRDTGISMIVYPAGHDTLPVRIFTLMANGAPSLIAALCVMMVAATLVPLAILSLGLKWLKPA